MVSEINFIVKISHHSLNDEEIISATLEINSDFELSESDDKSHYEAAEIHDSEPEMNIEEVVENPWTAGPFVPII